MNNFGLVLVLMGGSSAEREVSLASGQAVLDTLKNAGFDAMGFDPAERSLTDLQSMDIKRVFIMLHGRGGEDGRIQGFLDTLGIAYTGTGVLGSAIAMDKAISKQIWLAQGFPSAAYHLVCAEQAADCDYAKLLADLGGKVMVKPSHEGSSIGMAVASDTAELETAVNNALRYDQTVLIERYIDGDEYTVAILNGKALPSIRMQTPRSFYDYAAKYQVNTTQYFCPSGLSDEQESNLQELAVKAFHALHGEGWGRVDIMRDRQTNEWFLLESNTVPGMTQTSLVPKAAKQAGLSFEQLVTQILQAHAD
mgnify:CR=1 FL=1